MLCCSLGFSSVLIELMCLQVWQWTSERWKMCTWLLSSWKHSWGNSPSLCSPISSTMTLLTLPVSMVRGESQLLVYLCVLCEAHTLHLPYIRWTVCVSAVHLMTVFVPAVSSESQVTVMKTLVESLPEENQASLRYLITFLAQVQPMVCTSRWSLLKNIISVCY